MRFDELPPKTIGWGPWRQDWYSTCSRGRGHSPTCPACRVGNYVNRWRHFVGHCVFKMAPWLWRWRANR